MKSSAGAPTPGSSVGSYTIERELGRGGMGVVSLATDTRLERQVAIKALPDSLAADPDRLARFQREAKVLASLNHPHIGAIHGLEEHDGRHYLVLEYIQGETLADLLKRGPIPLDEALDLAKQIAEALEAAHDKGVVHRDIKPGNVMVSTEGGVKVLDFGLARTADGAPSSTGHSPVITETPTLTTPAQIHSPTIPGAIMGSAGYMSPEQARGKPVDRRSDIFSFGCVLYEMLTGRQPFPGETATDSIGAILHREPEWSLLPPTVPPRIRELLASCLAKDRRQRLHDIGDARIAIENAHKGWSGPAAPAARAGRGTWFPWAAAAVVCALVSAGAWLGLGRPVPPASPVIRSAIPITVGTLIDVGEGPVALSPDGRTLAIVAAPTGEPAQIWLRPLDSLAFQPLAGTEEATYPFWSPDSRNIGFFSKGRLRRIPAVGGTVTPLADSQNGRGGTWSRDDIIVYSPEPYSPLMRIAAAGGTPSAITRLDSDKITHRLPMFLPDGRRLLFTRGDASTTKESSEINLLDLATGAFVTLLKEPSRAFYSPPGYLVFIRGTTLMAQRFDADAGTLSGEAVVLAENASMNPNRFTGAASVAPNGALVYLPRASLSRLEWFDMEGRPLGAIGEPADFVSVEIAPRGDSAAAVIRREDGRFDVWLCDTVRGTRSRIIEDTSDSVVCWAPDATRLLYADRLDRCRLRELRGEQKDTDLAQGWPNDWTRDGRLIALGRQTAATYLDLQLIGPEGGEPRPFRVTPGREHFGVFSPDGAWIAYVSDATGRAEVVVAPVSGAGAPIQVVPTTPSLDVPPLWWLDDGTLIHIDTSGRKLAALPVTFKDGVPQLGTPRPAFGGLDIPSTVLDISPDGKRMLAAIPVSKGSAESLILVQNWPSGIAPAR